MSRASRLTVHWYVKEHRRDAPFIEIETRGNETFSGLPPGRFALELRPGVTYDTAMQLALLLNAHVAELTYTPNRQVGGPPRVMS